MHTSITAIYSAIKGYIYDRHLSLCAFGHFSEEKIEELDSVLSEMKKSQNLFFEHENNCLNAPETIDDHHMVVYDENTIRSWRKRTDLEKELTNNLSLLSAEEIARLTFGFTFIYDPGNSRLKGLLRLSKSDNIKTIVRKTHLYKKAVCSLREHIGYLKKYLNNGID
ncbi:hypothetical protein [Legionella feeleii]|uniref:Uncharacterized protein n=1 Tax=Legionella feeleii TaxID=453 RepID=A0A378KKM4_9GAMM|nr:hypothetical protein [Legionella feeleii]STX88388.1 Uncharacterised protein [Legionella feeleii]